MRDLDLTTLRLFVYVCESGSLVRASERANIVASAISKRLAQLEERLGTPLLVRKGYGVVPTTAGQTLLEHARAVFDSTGRIEQDMRNFAAGARGQVRVLASASAIAERLTADVVAFQAIPEHQTIHVDLEERMTPDIVRGVLQGMASLGVCWDAAELGGLQSRTYCTDHFCVVVPGRHPLASRRKVRFTDTLDYEQAGLPVNSATQVLMQRAAADLGRPLRQRIVVSTFEAAVRVVSTRAAICVSPREIAEPLANAFKLKLLPLDEPWAQRRFVICFRDGQALTPAAKLLLEHLALPG
jgi:DNA-binding transcriptional LysR family regulator